MSPALYHGIFMLKSNYHTSIELDTIMCANWLLKVQEAIFQSYSGWEKFVSKKSERGDSGMGQHGQRLNTGTCFSVSSDDKLVLFLFPGIPTGDPAIVAFYDKRIYKKLRWKELFQRTNWFPFNARATERIKNLRCNTTKHWYQSKRIYGKVVLNTKWIPTLLDKK